MKKTTTYLILFLAILCSLVSLYVVSETTYKNGLFTLSQKGQQTLEVYVTYLEGMLGKYESLPELFAQDDILVEALLHPGTGEQLDALNKYLESINTISNTSDTYLMNTDGLTIAASNWRAERPFIGRNFGYRPYFKEAMNGVLGRYFALGTTSSIRGYYFAYPVRKNDTILGAVVVKVNIGSAEKNWGHLNQSLIVTDPDGVVFITTKPSWRFKLLGDLDQKKKMRIEGSKRYPAKSLTPLNIVNRLGTGDYELFAINENNNKTIYLVQTIHMKYAGWDVKIFSDIAPIKKISTRYVLLTLFIELCAVIFFILLLQKQKRLSQLKEYEQLTRVALQEANEKLESRVGVRTAELTKSNKRLTREIIERKQTEETLKQTREELVHAAKLAALGQMSAGINHEMNQPLAAIRSYAENARIFLEKKRIDETNWNLVQICELTDRMGQIVAQLKLFSRKSSGKINRIPLHGAINGALEILKPSLVRSGISMKVSLQPDNTQVLANNVLLQQVFVNLINNAIQVLEGKEKGAIEILSTIKNGHVYILVKDNGPGIPDETLAQIFEPFFTTKISGKGLGLGLTITERILKEAEGKIFVSSSNMGSSFEIILREA